MSMLKNPWRLKLSSIWLKNGMPVSTLACPLPSISKLIVMSVSLVLRLTVAVRAIKKSPAYLKRASTERA